MPKNCLRFCMFSVDLRTILDAEYADKNVSSAQIKLSRNKICSAIS
jgi:hypothetical protein